MELQKQFEVYMNSLRVLMNKNNLQISDEKIIRDAERNVERLRLVAPIIFVELANVWYLKEIDPEPLNEIAKYENILILDRLELAKRTVEKAKQRNQLDLSFLNAESIKILNQAFMDISLDFFSVPMKSSPNFYRTYNREIDAIRDIQSLIEQSNGQYSLVNFLLNKVELFLEQQLLTKEVVDPKTYHILIINAFEEIKIAPFLKTELFINEPISNLNDLKKIMSNLKKAPKKLKKQN